MERRSTWEEFAYYARRSHRNVYDVPVQEDPLRGPLRAYAVAPGYRGRGGDDITRSTRLCTKRKRDRPPRSGSAYGRVGWHADAHAASPRGRVDIRTLYDGASHPLPRADYRIPASRFGRA